MDSIKLMEDAGNTNTLNNPEKKASNPYDNLNFNKKKSITEREDLNANSKYILFNNKEKEKDIRKSTDKINEMLSGLYPENSYKLSHYQNKNIRDGITRSKGADHLNHYNNIFNNKMNLNPSGDLVNNNDLGKMEEIRSMMKMKRKEIKDYKQI